MPNARIIIRCITSHLLAVFLVSSCGIAETRKKEERILTQHPVTESRMSDHPRRGFVKTGVWRVTGKNGNHMYLAGTSHLVEPGEIPFPSSYYAAFHESDILLMEINERGVRSSMQGIYSIPSMLMVAYKLIKTTIDEEPIGSTLSPETEAQLAKRYGERWVEIKSISPTMAIIMHSLSGGFITQNTHDPHGVEDVIKAMNRKNPKKTHGLDGIRIGSVLSPVMDMVIADTKELISEKGIDGAVREVLLDESHPTWRYGISDHEEKEARKSLAKYPGMDDILMKNRNHAWMKKILPVLEGHKHAAVYVGALHLPGPDGLIALLRQQGYQPIQMYGVDRPSTSK